MPARFNNATKDTRSQRYLLKKRERKARQVEISIRVFAESDFWENFLQLYNVYLTTDIEERKESWCSAWFNELSVIVWFLQSAIALVSWIQLHDFVLFFFFCTNQKNTNANTCSFFSICNKSAVNLFRRCWTIRIIGFVAWNSVRDARQFGILSMNRKHCRTYEDNGLEQTVHLI